MRIAIVDDEPEQIYKIKSLCMDFAAENSFELEADCFSSGEEFIDKFEIGKYSVIFMDIYMNEMNGIETAKRLRSADKDCMLIFLTSSTDFMPDAFSFHAFEYIIKPYSRERVYKVLKDALSRLSIVSKYVEISCGRNNVRISLNAIVSAVTNAHYIDIWLSDDTNYRSRMTISAFLDKLDNDERFIYINKGIIVNVDYIDSIVDCICMMKNDFSYPIRIRDRAKIELLLQIRRDKEKGIS